MPRRLFLALCACTLLFLVPTHVRGEDGEKEAEQALLDRLIAELRVEAEAIRGLTWKHDVPGAIIAAEDIPQAFQEEVDALLSKKDQAMATRVAKRGWMLSEGQDIWELQKGMMAGMAGGFYSPRTKKLYVVEGYSGDAARPVILHELIHALEDQHYDFQGVSLPLMNNTDRTFANGCVVEGSAETARIAYQARHKEIARLFQEASMDPENAKRQMQVMRTVPAWMIVPMMMQYQTGPAFVSHAVTDWKRRHPEATSTEAYAGVMQELWQDQPMSSEQVLHRERWFGDRRDYPLGIEWAADLGEAIGRGWEVVHEQRLGELDLALFLDRHLGGTRGLLNPASLLSPVPACEVARTAAAGWDAGRVAFIEKPGADMVMVQAWAFDTEEDATEAASALRDAIKAANGDAWSAQTWKAVAPSLGAPLTQRTLTYEGMYGPGRLMQRGPQVLLVDGAPAGRLDALWRWVEQTRFLRDPRDTWK